jgi:hypothetical protein
VADEHVEQRRALAERVVGAYVEGAGAVAGLLVGSVASGTADEWSDIDLVLFYDRWPGERLEAVTAALEPEERLPLGGDPSGPVHLEQLRLDGVACQQVHQTLDAWREVAASVLEGPDPMTPAQKALAGLHAGVVLHGEGVVAELRAAARYTPELAERVVARNRDVFPLWRLQASLASRDAELWQRHELVAGFEKVLGLLAGLNHVWFSTFQLKHVRDLVASFAAAPADLVDRMEAALVSPMPEAAAVLRDVHAEALALVDGQRAGEGYLGPAGRPGPTADSSPWSTS